MRTKTGTTPLHQRRSAYVPRLPHPSWRLGGEPAGRPGNVSAGDFWARLGI